MTKQLFMCVSPVFATTLLAAIHVLSPQIFGQVRVTEHGGYTDAQIEISVRPGGDRENVNDDERVPLSSQLSANFEVTAQASGESSRGNAISKTTLEGSYLFVDVNSPNLSGIKVNHSTNNTPRIDLPDFELQGDGASLYEATLSFDQSTPYSISGMVSGGEFRLPSNLGAFGPVEVNLPPARGGNFSYVGSVPPGTYEISSRLQSISNETLSYEINFGEPETLITWNASSGIWSEASNWDPQVVPGSNATAVLNTPETYTVNVGGQTVERLELGGGVSANATLTNMDLVVSSTSLGDPGVVADGGTFTFAGGDLKSTHAVIGDSSATKVSVTGASTRWDNQGRLTVGDGGEARLVVTDSGEVITPELRIGGAGFGIVDVQQNSQILGLSIAVGLNGDGALNITDGGFVGFDNVGQPSNFANVSVGTDGSTGRVLVSGVNADSGERSTLKVTNGGFHLGDATRRGIAEFSVDDGGLLEFGDFVSIHTLNGDSSLKVSSIHSDGTRSTYRANQSVTFGGLETRDSAEVEVLDGALYQDAGLFLQSDGVSKVSGVSGTTASTAILRDRIEIGNVGDTATLVVSDGGQVLLGVGNDDQIGDSSDLAVGTTFTFDNGGSYNGHLEITGVHSASGIASTVDLVSSGRFGLSGDVIVGTETNSGTIEITEGGQLVGFTGLKIDQGTVDVKGFDPSSGIRSTLRDNEGPVGSINSVSGLLRINDGAQAYMDTLDVGPGGLAAALGDGFVSVSGTGNGNPSILEIEGIPALSYGAYVGADSTLLANEGGQIKIGHSLAANGQVITRLGAITIGDVEPENGKLRIGPGGELTGIGTIAGDTENRGGVDNFGSVRPGNSPGMLTIDGDFTQGELGTTFFEIGGTFAGIDYDQVLVSGDASLEGNISIDFIDGFAPSEGDVFDLFSVTGATSVIGMMPVEVLGLEDGFEFDFGASDVGGVALVARNDGISAGGSVPEPSTFAIWTILGVCLVLAKRKRK